MNREDLVIEARHLQQLSPPAMEEFSAKREQLVAKFNTQFGTRPDLIHLIGEGNQAMMEDNHRNHARFLESIFGHHSAEVLVDTILWVFRAYRSHGFKLTYWPAQLDSWIELYRTELTPETFREVEPFYNWMIIRNPSFAMLSDAYLGDEPSHTP
ncbi:MAG: hypothetical protein WC824_05920 [Bacteroidota bacterium]|jgi:hypothetical protein